MAYVDPTVVNVGDSTVPDAGALAPAQQVAYSPDANALMPQQSASGGNTSDVTAYLRQAAIARGMDPDIAVKVAGHEGLNGFDPSKPDGGGDEGSSFGPLQLHYSDMSKSMPHAGLGDEFTAQTGLDARDPSTWKQQIDFGLDHASKNGWGAWMGAKAAGVGPWDGIDGSKAAGISPYTAPAQGSALALPAGAASPMGGDAATPTAANQFPKAPQSGVLNNSGVKNLMTLMYLKSALNNVQLQRVDYDPWAVIKGSDFGPTEGKI